MRILVTSAGRANGDGYGAILAFGPDGEFDGAVQQRSADHGSAWHVPRPVRRACLPE